MLIRRNAVVAAKIETTSGTIESLTASEAAFNIFNPVMVANIEMTARPAQGSMSQLPSQPGPRSATLTFSTELYGDGSGGVPAWASTLLPAVGMYNDSGTFKLSGQIPGSQTKTLTMAIYEDGRRKIMRGAAGSAKFRFNAGRIIMIDWTFQGVWQPVLDTAMLAPTYPTRSPIRAAKSTFSIGSVSPCFEAFEIDLGNNVYLRECLGNADDSGYAAAVITDRPNGVRATTDPEAKLVATDDRYGRWLAATTQALSIAFADADDTITFAAPAAQIVNLSDADRGGIRLDATEFLFCRNTAANDEFTITFGATP